MEPSYCTAFCSDTGCSSSSSSVVIYTQRLKQQSLGAGKQIRLQLPAESFDWRRSDGHLLLSCVQNGSAPETVVSQRTGHLSVSSLVSFCVCWVLTCLLTAHVVIAIRFVLFHFCYVSGWVRLRASVVCRVLDFYQLYTSPSGPKIPVTPVMHISRCLVLILG